MSFPRYERYRDSGEVWLGEVPEHWQVKRLRHLAHVQSGVAKGRDLADRETIQVPYLRVANVQDGYLDLDEIAMIDIEPHELARYALQPGDVLMNEGGDFDKLGRGYVWRGEIASCIHQNHVFAVRPHGIEPEWLALVTSAISSRSFFISRSKQSTNLASISQSNLHELPLCVPPRAERRAIVALLDRETAKIDALVEEQRRLIELLKEKRQAVISHAVTKGLDPNAPMKDSGVEWLGQVPEHWEVCALKRLCTTITDGAHISPETENGVFCFVSTKDLVGEGIDFDGCLRTSEASYEYLVRTGCQPRRGDVLFSKDGTVGRTVVVHEDREFVVASSLIIIRPDQRLLNAAFLHKLCQSHLVGNQVESYVKGAGLPRLSIQNLLKVVGVFPPIPEQLAIAAFLDQETAKIDELAQAAERGIALLQERRAALISAAVTGKVDVRGATPATAEAA